VSAAKAQAAGGFDLGERIRTAPTPARMKALLYAVWVIAGILFLVGEGALGSARAAMQTVGRDTAPSIIAAQSISSGLADIDANAGNYLLGTKIHQDEALKTFEKRRLEVTQSLVKAAQNITYGAEESVPINTLFDGFGRYLELFSEARYRKDIHDDAGAIRVYGYATEDMHARLLTAADNLDSANRGYLDRAFHKQQGNSEAAALGAGLVGGLLVLVLVYAQVFLLRKTRRILNLPLLGATVVAVVYALYLVTRISVAREDLRVAKEDAFDSIHALWKARAIAYDANGDETRYLLGGERAGYYEAQYHEKVQKLTSKPQIDPGALTGALTGKKMPKDLTGLFADELNNITFEGEGAAAIEMTTAFGRYDKLDQQMRALERAGKHDKAVDLCIGSGADQSNAAFDRFDKALLDVIDINHKQFDLTVDQGTAALVTAAELGPLAMLAVALLALFGIRPRLREYAA
jgi:hypothetical protein